MVAGIGGLIILVIIILLIVSTLRDSNLMPDADSTTVTVTNESGWVNSTGYTLDGVGTRNSGFTITEVWNVSSNTTISSGNYSVSTAGVVTNASDAEYNTAFISYTYSHQGISYENDAVSNITSNLTEGIGHVALQLSTILKIAAIVLLLGVIVFLVTRTRPLFSGSFGSEGSL